MSRTIKFSASVSEIKEGQVVFELTSSVDAQIDKDIDIQSFSHFKGNMKEFVNTVDEMGDFFSKAVKAEINKISKPE